MGAQQLYYRTHKKQIQKASREWRIRNKNQHSMRCISEGFARHEQIRYDRYRKELSDLLDIL